MEGGVSCASPLEDDGVWREFFGRLEGAQLGSEVRDRFLGALAVASAVYGDAERVIGLLDRVRDAYAYVDASLSAAAELCWKGLVEKVDVLIGECLRRMAELSRGEAGALAPKLAYVKALAEGVDEGVSVAMREEGVWRCRSVLAVASAIIERGIDGLDAVLEEFDSCVRLVFDEEKAGLLIEAGKLLLEAGKADEARGMLRRAVEVAMNIYDEFSKRMILSSLVPATISAGMLKEAVVLSGILGLAGLHYLERIGEAAGVNVVKMPFDALDAYGRAVLALRGAEVSLSREAVAKAAEHVRLLSGRSWYPELLARLAVVQAKTGEEKEGEANVGVAVELASGAQLVKVASVIAECYASHAERALEKACREAEGLRKEEKILVLMSAAVAWSRIGREEKAEECFKEAVKLLVELGSSELLVELSRHLALSRKPEAALRSLMWLLDDESKVVLLAQTASILVEEGRVEEGVKLAEEAHLTTGRGVAAFSSMARLAVSLSKKGRVREAQKIAPIIADGIMSEAFGNNSEVLRLLNSALELAPRLRLLVREGGERAALILLNRGGGCVNIDVKLGGLTMNLSRLDAGGAAHLKMDSSLPFESVSVKFEDAFGVEECVFKLKASR